MATVVSQHVRHLGCYLGFFKNFILSKTAANFTEISRKHVFAASNWNIIENKAWVALGKISELLSNFFVNVSTFKVQPCFASPGKIPQNEQKDQRHRSVWVGHDKFLKIG